MSEYRFQPNPSQLAIIDVVTKLKDEGQPAHNIVDALLYIGGMLLPEAVEPHHIDKIAKLVADVAKHPDNPISNQIRAWMNAS